MATNMLDRKTKKLMVLKILLFTFMNDLVYKLWGAKIQPIKVHLSLYL